MTQDTNTASGAAERDALLQAALDFIKTLTGMNPPPIEVAPPEVFAPFRAFVDRVQAITSQRAALASAPAQPSWLKYNPSDDVLTIHGKRYSAAMFGEAGFLSPPGTLLRVESGHPDCVTLHTVTPAQPVAEQANADSVLEDAERHFFDAGWKACANFCDRDDVRFDGIVGHRGGPQFEEAFRAALAQKDGKAHD